MLLIFSQFFLLNLLGNGKAHMVGDDNPYHRHEILDTQGKYHLEWKVNWSEKQIMFNVTVATRGFVGFGLSDKGKMSGADIVIGGVYPSGTPYFSDRHAVGNHIPELDLRRTTDWILTRAWENNTHTHINFVRAFDTCDPQDYPITENKISVIWAYGEHDTISYHHSTRGQYPVYLLFPDYTPPTVHDIHVGSRQPSSSTTLKVWSIRSRMQIRAEDTTYWCTMHKAPSLPHKHQIVGFEVRFADALSQRHTHHFLLHRCRAPQGRDARRMFASYLNHPGQTCIDVKTPMGPMPTEYCTQFAVAWGVGGRPFFYPPHVGVPFAESTDEFYLLQVHYNNPQRLSNIFVDHSIDMYYTSELRPHDAGIIIFRQESPGMPPSHLIPPMSPEHKVYGLCGGDCTSEMFPSEGIRVFATFPHSHNTGVSIRLKHFRGNRELPWIQEDNNYDFNFQQIRMSNGESRIFPGDMLVARCIYDNTRLNGSTTVGGFSTQQEMCSVAIYYYNFIPNFIQCSSQIESEEGRQRFLGVGNVTWSNAELEWIAQEPENLKGMKISEISDNRVKWTVDRREEYQRWVLQQPHVQRCPPELYSQTEEYHHSHVRAENNAIRGRLVQYPFAASVYQPPSGQCSMTG